MIWLTVVLLYVKVNRTIAFVSVPVLYYLLDKCHNFRHKLTDTSNTLWKLDVQSTHIIKKLVFVSTRQLFERDILLKGFSNDLVINVCNVHNKFDVVAEVVSHNTF